MREDHSQGSKKRPFFFFSFYLKGLLLTSGKPASRLDIDIDSSWDFAVTFIRERERKYHWRWKKKRAILLILVFLLSSNCLSITKEDFVKRKEIKRDKRFVEESKVEEETTREAKQNIYYQTQHTSKRLFLILENVLMTQREKARQRDRERSKEDMGNKKTEENKRDNTIWSTKRSWH